MVRGMDTSTIFQNSQNKARFPEDLAKASSKKKREKVVGDQDKQDNVLKASTFSENDIENDHNFTSFGRLASPPDDCCCCFAGDSIGGGSVRSKLVSYHEVGSFSDSKCVNTVTLGNAWRMSASILSNSR